MFAIKQNQLAHAAQIGVFAAMTLTATLPQARASEFTSALTSRALAAFGFVAVPNETASTLDYQVANGEDFNFSTTQLGGGFRPIENGPIYLEGFLGWQSYDPALLISPSLPKSLHEAADTPQNNWSSRGATGAIGYNFDLASGLTIRPAIHLAIGEVASDSSLVPDIPILPGFGSKPDAPELGGGRLTTGGYGASLGLEYMIREPAREVDIRARYTWMRLVDLENDPLITSEADALAASIYGRYRHPISDWKVFDRPLRAVWEASSSAYPGDQGSALDTPWLAQIGTGLEVDTSALPVPYLDCLRLVARYAVGQNYDGYSIGLGVTFRRTR
ncbi:MAG: hypothetical protein OIF40_11400 [Mangrovicoccus sp.]|nr:hypothetical protein [Mangrovicoccus sp.]